MFERTGPTRCCAFLLPKVTYVKIVWCNSADLNTKETMNGTAKRFRIVQLLRKEGLESELRGAQQQKWPNVSLNELSTPLVKQRINSEV